MRVKTNKISSLGEINNTSLRKTFNNQLSFCSINKAIIITFYNEHSSKSHNINTQWKRHKPNKRAMMENQIKTQKLQNDGKGWQFNTCL